MEHELPILILRSPVQKIIWGIAFTGFGAASLVIPLGGVSLFIDEPSVRLAVVSLVSGFFGLLCFLMGITLVRTSRSPNVVVYGDRIVYLSYFLWFVSRTDLQFRQIENFWYDRYDSGLSIKLRSGWYAYEITKSMYDDKKSMENLISILAKNCQCASK